MSPMPAEHDFIDRSVYISVQIDTNRINSRQANPAMNRLEEWYRHDIIDLSMSEIAQDEAAFGVDSRRRRKAYGYIFSQTLASTPDERQKIKAIEAAIFPGGATSQSERNDVEIVFNASKYQAILVTADGNSKSQPRGILGSRAALALLGICVMTAEQAVAYIAEQIAARDRNIVEGCWCHNLEPPGWVGLDAPEYPVDFSAFCRDRAQDEPVAIACFRCYAQFGSTLRQLRNGSGSTCPGCGEDLRPSHADTTCRVCRGQGLLVVNGTLWVCTRGGSRKQPQGNPPVG